MKTSRQTAARDSGTPGAGKGRKEEVRGSGIYPASGPPPPGKATLKTPGSVGHKESAGFRRASTAVIVGETRSRGRTTAAMARAMPRKGQSGAVSPSSGEGDIPRESWREYFDQFSEAHEGWPTDLKVFQPDQTARVQAHSLPLEGVAAEVKGPEASVSIVLGDEAADHLTHTMGRVVRVTAVGEDELEIDAADLGRAVVHCRKEAA